MEFAGERIIMGEVDHELKQDHKSFYNFAKLFVKDKRVLDAACGSGYGSAILGQVAKEVAGIDNSYETIEYARKKFAKVNISFEIASLTDFPYKDQSFDVVVSFETLEHVNEERKIVFLEEVKRILKHEGILIISIMNSKSDKKTVSDSFQVKEPELKKFENLLKDNFSKVYFLDQNHEVFSNIISKLPTSEYLVTICSNKEIDELNAYVEIKKDDRYRSLLNWALKNHRIIENNTRINELEHTIEVLKQTIKIKESKIISIKQTLNDRNITLRIKSELLDIMEYAKYQQNLIISDLEKNSKNDKDLIASLEEKNFVKDERIKNDKDLIASLEKQIYELNEKARDMNCSFLSQNKFLEQQLLLITKKHEEKTKELNQIILNKEGHIALLLESDRELDRITNSRSWRYMTYIWKLRDFILPKDSKRRLLVKLIYKSIKLPRRVIKMLTRSNVKKFFYYLNREGVSGVSRRIDEYIIGTKISRQVLSITPVEDSLKKNISDYEKISFKTLDHPTVSIIIPVYNQFGYTYNCLKSILENSGDINYEVIIANDCSTDLTTCINEVVSGIRVITNKENLRFLKNCNNAAKFAKGKYILFLNNDTQVQENWLNPLITLIESNEKVGMVGSKLVYPDGRLQEAGGIFWKDASAWNYGHRSDPNAPEFNYVKEVDYISGASIMILSKLWEEIGGFDETFAPAYCEDSDLAFTVRSKGFKVMYQPQSVVVHFEGVSNGTDTSSGQKAYQVVNQKKFFEKWKAVLEEEHFPNGEHVFLARDRTRNKKTIVVVDHYIPTFDKDAGSRTVYLYLKLLVDMGFNVKLIGDNFYKSEPYASQFEQIGIEILYGPYFANHWKDWLKENAKYINHVFLNRPHISIKYIDFIREHMQAKITYYGHDLHFLRELREYKLTGNEALLDSSTNWKQIELGIMKKADTVFTLSTDEQLIINEELNCQKALISPIFYFKKFDYPTNNVKDKKDIIFVGGFGHRPNEDGVLWFTQYVWGKIQDELPDVRFIIIGSKPTDKIKELASERIIVTGFVSDEELADYYQNSRICVIPLRYGAGVKGKTIEAMYHKTAIVSTSIGIEGLPDIDEYIQATDKEEDFANRVVELYENDILLEETINKYSQYIKEHFSYEQAWGLFEKVFS